jgi:hypothetical protein
MAACDDHFFTDPHCRRCNWETNHKRIQDRADQRSRESSRAADARTDRLIGAQRQRDKDRARASRDAAIGAAVASIAIDAFDARRRAKKEEEEFLASPAGKRHLEVLEGQRREAIDLANPDPDALRTPAGQHTAMIRYAKLSDRGRAALHRVIDEGLDESDVPVYGNADLEKGLGELVLFEECTLERFTHQGSTYVRVVLSVSMFNAMHSFYPPSRPGGPVALAPAPAALEAALPPAAPSLAPALPAPSAGDLTVLRAVFSAAGGWIEFHADPFLLGWASRTSAAGLLEVRPTATPERYRADLTPAGDEVFAAPGRVLDLSRVSTGALSNLDALLATGASYVLAFPSRTSAQDRAELAELVDARALVVAERVDEACFLALPREARALRTR